MIPTISTSIRKATTTTILISSNSFLNNHRYIIKKTTRIRHSTLINSSSSCWKHNYIPKIHCTHLSTTKSNNKNYETFTLLEEMVSSSSIANKVQSISNRYDEIMTNMIHHNHNNNNPNIETNPNHSIENNNNNNNNYSNNHNQNDQTTKELSSLSQIYKLYTTFQNKVHDLNEMNDLLHQVIQNNNNDKDDDDDDDEQEMIKECQNEIITLKHELKNVSNKIIEAMIPCNENDYNTDAILELRAGTGGDEATLFCGELLSCYERVASSKGWVFDVLSKTTSDLKGVKEAAVSISCNSGGSGSGGGYYYYSNEDESGQDRPLGPYGYFKFESGVHRVQRVPVNDVRIHTSAASVAVLPAPNSDAGKGGDDLLPLTELKIETMRASGAGGQHVNTTESAVRITHIPTGITASIQDERSQHKNKAKAMKLITARVRDKVEGDEARKRGDAKNSLMGGGDRSERIRTYNFPQDRITDHRCKHSEHGIEKLLSGGSGSGGNGDLEDSGLVGTFLPFMKKLERVELMAALESEENGS